MKFKTTAVGGTVEILAAADFDAVPFTVTETDASADGILLYDADPAENPNAALVVRGIIDQKKAEKHAGVTYEAAALKTAVPGIVLRDNVGVNAADTE